MPLHSREIVFLMLQFLEDEKYKDTVHKLEQESGFYFDMKYFEELITNGDYDEAERYLSGFTKVEDNCFSIKIFFEIRKLKYLEALDRQDRTKAFDILIKDLKVFSKTNEEIYKQIKQLLTLEHFRENEQLSNYVNIESARQITFNGVKKLIEANPLMREKLQYPPLKASRLRTLLNQSLNRQHQLCKNTKANPYTKTLFDDHSCEQPNATHASSNASNPLMGVMPKPADFPQFGTHGRFAPGPVPLPTSMAGWTKTASPVAHPALSGGLLPLKSPMIAAATMLRRPVTPQTNYPAAMDYDSKHVAKRARPATLADECSANVLPDGFPGQGHAQIRYPSDDLPKAVAVTLKQGASVMSMDFHPVQPTLLLVGTIIGDIGIWEVATRERVTFRNFKVWDPQAATVPLQAALDKDSSSSINRVTWSPDGSLFGVAFSKNIVQLYSYHGSNELRQHLEIDAHSGNVNDLAFASPDRQLCFITCGEDKTIKVWDAISGAKQFTFEGHEASIFSLCPHYGENIQFLFSTDYDGKIKAWLYDNMGSRATYEAPGRCCTTMAYSSVGSRLFSCGTSKDGESHIVEWHETEGSIKQQYQGFQKRSVGIIQFDTTKNQYLACGDEFMVKFWDMDDPNMLTTADVDGGLPASPRIRFNKDGMLLAVSTNDNGIKILANSEGLRLLHAIQTRSFDGSRIALESGMKNGEARNLEDVKPQFVEEQTDKANVCEISEPSQCCNLRLPESFESVKVSCLMYNYSGAAILALTSNAVHKLWKWQRNDHNATGKATTSVAPPLWKPSNGILMTDDISDANPEDAVPCFALTKNDAYIISSCGGRISLFNILTFKAMTIFNPPDDDAATCLAFRPQDNNVVAIGQENSEISIYHVRTDRVLKTLRGHKKRVTGFTFSNKLNALVSSGADAQLCVWSTDTWEKMTSKFLQIPSGCKPGHLAETRVQFHKDQIHLLAVHETQLAIYEAPKLECVKQFVTRESSAPITHAVYSCDSGIIYTSFANGSVSIFSSATLRLRCQISPTAYLPPSLSTTVYPTVVAAHPSERNQFALGLTDGAVLVFEPLKSEGKWGAPPPLEGSAGSNIGAGSPASEHAPR